MSQLEFNVSGQRVELAASLLTGGWDRPYAFGLATALTKAGIGLEIVVGEDLTAADFPDAMSLTVLPFKDAPRPGSGLTGKIARVLAYYGRLTRYAFASRPRIVHILWNNSAFDRCVLMPLYRLLGKRVVFTAHNVNARRRDGTDTALNRLALTCEYRLSDHIFVHTEKMKQELVAGFGCRPERVTVIPFGLNNSVPDTALTGAVARARLGIADNDKTLLFFGNIAPYKGLEYLVAAYQQVAAEDSSYRLIVAGRAKFGAQEYWERIASKIAADSSGRRVTAKIEFVPDADTEIYFKAADVLVLPYTEVFQSGVLFLGYSFGLPALAADVGSLRDDIVDGENGFVFATRDSNDLARAIRTYFASELYYQLAERRRGIREGAARAHSWDTVAELTRQVYRDLLEPGPHGQRRAVGGRSVGGSQSS